MAIKIPDLVSNAQPLIQRGIIYLPERIGHDEYVQLSASLEFARELHPEAILELRCKGQGGFTSAALALADQIMLDGNIAGIAYGDVCSGASIVFAACALYFAGHNARLLVHESGYTEYELRWQRAEHRRSIRISDSDLEMMLDVYTRLSPAGDHWRKWWAEQIEAGGYNGSVIELRKQPLLRIEPLAMWKNNLKSPQEGEA